MAKLLAIALALLFTVTSVAYADQKPGGNPESPSDDNSGTGNDPPGGAGGAPPGQTNNPNPGKLFEPPSFSPAEQFTIMAHHTTGADKHGLSKPSGTSGPGQKGQPGPEGGPSGP